MIEDLRDPYGIIVAARAAGAAGEIPLTTGDVIRTFNGEPMTTLGSLARGVESASTERGYRAANPARR